MKSVLNIVRDANPVILMATTFVVTTGASVVTGLLLITWGWL